jgi:hypothetical protein
MPYGTTAILRLAAASVRFRTKRDDAVCFFVLAHRPRDHAGRDTARSIPPYRSNSRGALACASMCAEDFEQPMPRYAARIVRRAVLHQAFTTSHADQA